MRLLILTQVIDRHDPALGFFHAWVEEFAQHVENIEVLCLRKGEYDLPANVHVHSLGKEHGASRLTYLSRFYRLVWSKRHDYDAVFIHMNSEYLVLGGLIWKLLGKRTLLWHTHKSMHTIHRIGEKLVDVVATASPESYRLKSHKLRVLGHGIDTKAFCPNVRAGDGIFRILSTGRISRVKGLHTILESVASLLASGIPTELLILGPTVTKEDIAYQKELEVQVSTRGLLSVVHFVGPVSHKSIIPYLQKADVFVNCSNTGSLDKAVLEAMAVGTPVITSNDGLTSTLGRYAKELMFPHGDATALTERLRHIKVLPPRERQALSAGLREIVTEGHSLQRLIPRMVELLH